MKSTGVLFMHITVFIMYTNVPIMYGYYCNREHCAHDNNTEGFTYSTTGEDLF